MQVCSPNIPRSTNREEYLLIWDELRGWHTADALKGGIARLTTILNLRDLEEHADLIRENGRQILEGGDCQNGAQQTV